MSLLDKLSPDVLEVLQEVAKQEDSFLLRVSRVPLERMTDPRAPVLRASAPFLTPAERHLLGSLRDDLALAAEYLLFKRVIETPDVKEALRSHFVVDARMAGRIEQALAKGRHARVVRDRLLRSEDLRASRIDSAALTAPGWRSLARAALCLRVRPGTLANMALGYLCDHEYGAAQDVLMRCTQSDADVASAAYANLALVAFEEGRFADAAALYTSAYEIDQVGPYVVCASLNAWLGGAGLSSSARQELQYIERNDPNAFRAVAAALRVRVNATGCARSSGLLFGTEYTGSPLDLLLERLRRG